jgi:hypothetical protein
MDRQIPDTGAHHAREHYLTDEFLSDPKVTGPLARLSLGKTPTGAECKFAARGPWVSNRLA